MCLGRLHFLSSGRRNEAEANFQRAVEIQERLARDHPRAQNFALNLAANYAETAIVLREVGEYAKALDFYARNVAVLESLLLREPQHVDARRYLCGTLMGRAETYIRLQRRADAVIDWQRMVVLSEGQSHADLREYHAHAQAYLGNHERATHEVDVMLAERLTSQGAAYNFACIFSLASAGSLRTGR